MGRNRTPTAVLELRGSFKRHPERRRARLGEVRSETLLPHPPINFTKDQKLRWQELKNLGTWPTGPDRYLAEIAVLLLDKHTRRVIDYKEIPHLISVLSLLGFTPKDRAKMKVAPINPADQS